MKLHKKLWTPGLTLQDRIFGIIVNVLSFLFFFICLFPLWFMIVASVSDPDLVNSGQVFFYPKGWNVTGFELVFEDSSIWIGYLNTIFYALVQTILSLAQLFMLSFALSYNDLPGKKFYTILMLIPMFISGGLIPTYLLLKKMHFVNSIWVLLLPLGGCGLGNVAVVRTYMRTAVPWELREAAEIDGCSLPRCFFTIILPLCKPIIAVMALGTITGVWNNYTTALIYITDKNKYPLALILREILVTGDQARMLALMGDFGEQVLAERMKTAQLIKYATMIVSTLPLLIIYPFLQKYFVKGIMIGSLKG